ncbi:1-acyl-sn-glycerol-3-phosphate acyltransferase [Cellulomonas cellasea]|uniref:1-acyl-sn-glycerol-3-phosphate acyltransferase n=1 Tax=Cellulomonas cellasea TaxID=43670 RepID=A0A7W4UDJ0_9CELL|nr:lysophospholipid acyltransferase family protein [Cellulomonas cellasea]MBB2921665.1 1-acyl-sn-glycerol-3-phosphate acyltransferase [Cellulomonas cellasea]
MSAAGVRPAADAAAVAPGHARGQWVGRLLAHGVWDTRVTGTGNLPADGPVLLAANHLGVLDGPVLFGVTPRPVNLLVKHEMFRGPVGALLRWCRQIPVDRANGRPALTAALAVLTDGGVVGVFPEGNRGRGDVTSARAGIAWLAVNSGATVLPVAVLGTRRTGESVRHLPAPRRRLAVEFGAPLDLAAAPGASRREALAAAQEAIRTGLASHVTAAAARTGLTLPTDDPEAPRRSPGPTPRPH